MNLLNEEITHKVFGKGDIIEQDDSFITIDFNDEVKKFVYPDAFGTFITLNNEEVAESMESIISKRMSEKAKQEKIEEEKREQQALERQRKEFLRNHNIHESSQVVFWLDEEEQGSVFSEWELTTGEIQSGNNKGQPNRAARLSLNTASLLTKRDEDEPEEDRIILGIYMMTENFDETLIDKGIVPSHTKFKIELTEEESEKMLFWNYYMNKNHPDRVAWNSGKYRYYDNVWTAQILQDIIALRTDEEERKKVEEFLAYFCKINALDIDNIPEAEGALKQNA